MPDLGSSKSKDMKLNWKDMNTKQNMECKMKEINAKWTKAMRMNENNASTVGGERCACCIHPNRCRDKPYRLTLYWPRIGFVSDLVKIHPSTTVFDMQPRSSHGNLLKWFGQVWSISKSQRSMGTVNYQPNMFSSLGAGVPLERGFWRWVFSRLQTVSVKAFPLGFIVQVLPFLT